MEIARESEQKQEEDLSLVEYFTENKPLDSDWHGWEYFSLRDSEAPQ
jgi:hypothetical protein